MNPIASRRNFAVLVVALFSLALVSASAANTVSYQGILTNAGGDSLLSGEYDFVFAIFPQSTGGTAWWTETHNDVDVENGIYSVILGSTTALPDSIGDSSWLQITVNGTPLTPRLAITADFRAIEARRAENADSVNHIPASATPQANHLLPLDSDAKIPLVALPFTLDSIQAGAGLTGTVTDDIRRPNSLDDQMTINVGAGDGIIINPDNVQATLGTSISTAELENGSVFTGKLADNAVITSKLADNSVTTGKVVDNTLVVADIAPDIVSSVDGVHNDGGDIDLIPGPHIGITPNDANNTITISADAVQYLAGRCMNIVDSTINNVMDIQAGDECIAVEYDANQCLYTLRNLMDVVGGECVDVTYDSNNCVFVISVDPSCFADTIIIQHDSIFSSEVYAKSFVVTEDGTIGSARAHLKSDGTLEIYDANGRLMTYVSSGQIGVLNSDSTKSTVIDTFGVVTGKLDGSEYIRMNNDGTWTAVRNGQTVAGLDTAGESYAKSFYVWDPAAGMVRAHITSDGNFIRATSDGQFQHSIDEFGFVTGTTDGTSFIRVNRDGTWGTVQNGVQVAGLQTNGEIHAKSFEVRDSLNGEVKAHLDNDGNLALTAGAQITIGGEPIGQGGAQDSIFDSEVYAHSFVVTPDGSLENETAHILSDGTFQNRNANDEGGFDINPDGTWEAYQGDPDIPVAGLDDEGEMYANSFYVPGPTIGSMLAHITGTGDLVGVNHVASGYMYSPTAIFSSNVGGSQASDLAPGYMRTQTYTSTTPVTGWSFLNNGTMQNRIDPAGPTPAMLMHEVNTAGQCVHYGEVFMGPVPDGNHIKGLGSTVGTGFSNNVTIFGDLTVEGDLIGGLLVERFPAHHAIDYVSGMVIIADPASENYILCNQPYQTSAVGIVSARQREDFVDEILVVTHGSASIPRKDGSRLEVRVKADAQYGAIKRGDLLTTSATQGHAMLASDPKLGTIIGKALEPLASGAGEIKVMVTLQ